MTDDDEILRAAQPERVGVLRRAEALTCGPRNASYGSPVQNMQDTADLWSVVLGVPVTAQQVAICMSLVKVARLVKTPDHQDSHDDAAAYMAIAYECAVAKKDAPPD